MIWKQMVSSIVLSYAIHESYTRQLPSVVWRSREIQAGPYIYFNCSRFGIIDN